MDFSSSPVVSLKDVTIYQDVHTVLSQVNFDIEKGEFVYLIGRTGSGKSSLLKTLYADLPLQSGLATVAGFKIYKIGRSQVPYLRRKIGIVFQDFQLLYDRTVAENLSFVLKATGWKEKSRIQNRISEVLMRVGMGAAGNKMPHQLSGGEQQRVVIARALLNEPVILLADEPTGNLDPGVSEGIMQIFLEINNAGTAVLMATHNHQIIQQHPKRILKCEQGRVLDSTTGSFAMTDVQ
jgi:cell division transport system ATP-binding protein